MGFYSLFYDYYYVLLVLPAIIASLIIQIRLKSIYKKYSGIQNMRHISGAMAAQEVLRLHNIPGVGVTCSPGKLSDHYDPRSRIIALSPEVFNGTSVAAVGIACHEAGHAVQHAQAYKPISVRNAILPVCNIGSSLSFPLIILGFFLSFEPLIYVGIILFSAVVLFQLVTLPVEFNASSRAVEVIETSGMLNGEEVTGVKKVLRAAAMTYVAALAVSVAQLLRLILRFTGNRR